MDESTFIRKDSTGEYYGISVRRGDTFQIKKSQNASTGYSWQIQSTPGLQLIDEKVILPHGTMPGAPGIKVWTFKAIGNEPQRVKAIYSRPWENQPEHPLYLDIDVV